MFMLLFFWGKFIWNIFFESAFAVRLKYSGYIVNMLVLYKNYLLNIFLIGFVDLSEV